MAVTVNHIFTNPIADGTITSIVRPSDWNSVHVVTLDASMASNRGSDFVQATAAFNGTNASGTIASNGISVSVGPYITTAMASNRASDFVAATAGFNGTSASGTIASNSISISIGPYITTAMASNRASDFVAATAGFNGTSVSGTIASNSISISVGPYLTTAMASNRASDFVAATAGFNGTSVSGTIASNSISISVGPYLTTAAISAHSHGVSFTSGSVGFQTLSFTNSNGISFNSGTQGIFGSHNAITTARASTDALGLATAGTNITWTANSAGVSINAGGYAGTNTATTGAISVTLNTSGISLNVGAYITTADLSANSSKYVQNWKLTGHTSGTTSSAQGTDLWFQGNNITVSGSSNSIVLSAPQTSSLVGTSGISISTAGSTISIYQPVASQFDPFMEQPITNSSLGQSTLYFMPFDLGEMLSASRINFFHSITHTYSGAAVANNTAWLGAGYGLYTRMTGTGTDRISLLTSYSMSYMSGAVSSSTRLSMTNYFQISNGTTHSTTQYGVQNATASNFLINSFAGYRPVAFPVSQLLTPGRYWVGYSIQSSSQHNSFVLNHSVMQVQVSNQLAYRPFNVSSAASNASFYDVSNGAGIYSVQSAAWPVSIPLTSDSIRAALINTFPVFNFSGISQSSNIL